jgi:transposase
MRPIAAPAFPPRHLDLLRHLQADAYGGYNPLFKVDRDPAPLRQALCWAHSRRKFFVLADIAANAKRGSKAAPISPMALEAVKRIDALFDIEREINGLAAEQRLERRRQLQPLDQRLSGPRSRRALRLEARMRGS